MGICSWARYTIEKRAGGVGFGFQMRLRKTGMSFEKINDAATSLKPFSSILKTFKEGVRVWISKHLSLFISCDIQFLCDFNLHM